MSPVASSVFMCCFLRF